MTVGANPRHIMAFLSNDSIHKKRRMQFLIDYSPNTNCKIIASMYRRGSDHLHLLAMVALLVRRAPNRY